ncbi:hypothetical protein [Streptantibioticus ferralitis]|uniref:Uncharacterized protein n=1 Tax=Streptantibioticus ferralitis TaxID=236510 RepID=A0ABT5YY15_9ACTN|nr:hypothetical protein [Streptantibioticus ferralitis]MDF2256493.1 hypothetical protein [Streptantibioticus ferralitis]
MPVRTAQAERRRWTPAVIVAATAAGAVGLVGVTPAVSGGHDTHRVKAKVDCDRDPGDLRIAIASAPKGARLLVKGTCVGPFRITKDLTLIGRERAVLDGNHTGSTVTVIRATPGSPVPRVRLTNLMITHGTTASGGIGGGIRNEGFLRLNDSTVKGNSAPGGVGGGIFNSATLTVKNSKVSHNTAGAGGGGIVNDKGTATLIRSTVSENTAPNGGGIVNDGTAELDRSRVRHNRATNQGGGISNGGTLTLRRSSKVAHNTADGGPGSGGGIFNSGKVRLDHSKVRDNRPENCAPPGSVRRCKG